MPIPPLNAEGFLPPGAFDCSLVELKARFATFQGSDRRGVLFDRLQELISAMAKSKLFEALVVDGSFVTAAPNPNDIDLIAVLRFGHNFEEDLPVSKYSLVSRSLLRRRFGFDALVAESGSALYNKYVEFFSRVRGSPGIRKGLLRISL
jgi:hypothetical protein